MKGAVSAWPSVWNAPHPAPGLSTVLRGSPGHREGIRPAAHLDPTSTTDQHPTGQESEGAPRRPQSGNIGELSLWGHWCHCLDPQVWGVCSTS